MANELQGRKVAILIAPIGTEQVEFVQPKQAVEAEGATVEAIGIQTGEAQAMNNDTEMGDTFTVDKAVTDVSPDEYDALIVPGGTVGADNLRADPNVVEFVRGFFEQAKPVGVICHGPWTLVEADVVRGRRITSFPSVRTDLRNAGAEVVDEEVVQDGNIITSRNPDDLPAFCDAVVRELSAVHAR